MKPLDNQNLLSEKESLSWYSVCLPQSVSEDLMGFVKEMWRQNSSLVDAFEKSQKKQQSEKKRMKQELVSLINQVHHGNSAPTNEVREILIHVHNFISGVLLLEWHIEVYFCVCTYYVVDS